MVFVGSGSVSFDTDPDPQHYLERGSSVSGPEPDPDSGVFWIRVPNPDPGL